MNKTVIIVLALAVVAIGIGAYFMLNKKSSPSSPEVYVEPSAADSATQSALSGAGLNINTKKAQEVAKGVLGLFKKKK